MRKNIVVQLTNERIIPSGGLGLVLSKNTLMFLMHHFWFQTYKN
jgi:hypothetical protein